MIIHPQHPVGSFSIMDVESVEGIRDPVALAIWTYLRTKPKGWKVRKEDIKRQFDIGEHTYRRGMKVLKDVGAMELRRKRDDCGKVYGSDYIVHYCTARSQAAEERAG